VFQEVAAIIQRCCLFITNSSGTSQIFGALRPELGHCNHSREGLSLPGVSIAEEFDSRFNGLLLLSRGCFDSRLHIYLGRSDDGQEDDTIDSIMRWSRSYVRVS